ncbi:MAG: SpvB/TcaC N-terminal domain-containing protein, partial [bacterium]
MPKLRSLLALALLAPLVPATAFALGGPSPGAVSAQTVKLPTGPGSVRGLADAAQVNGFTGQVQYAVPIELPAGPGGLKPALSIGYDGDLGNGPLGVGWSLAQPGVRRSLRLGVPKYNATDEVELVGLGGGQVIALASGELRVEGAGNAITGRAVAGGYELTDADGRVYRFGTTSAARKASGTMVSAWYLEEVRDVAGNTVAYHYVADKGEVYLDSIEWGPTAAGARAFRAALEYEARADAVVSYRTGFRVESAKRLARVKVFSFGAVQRIAELGYDSQFALTRVSRVRVTSADGSQALPETRFTYAATAHGTQAQVSGLAGWALNAQGTSLFDVDNDGAVDLLRLTSTGHSWRRNTGGQFATAAAMPGASSVSLTQVRLVDLDGDSVAEMLVQQGSQWVVHKLDRASASWIPLGPLGGSSGISLSGVAIADINGDQRMDVLSTFGSQIQVRLAGASGLGAPVN